MKEDKIIESLFEAARNEAPKQSFEEVANNFTVATQPLFWESARDWLLNNISLNSFVAITVTTIIGITALMLSSSKSTNEAVVAATIINDVKKESTISVSPTIETKAKIETKSNKPKITTPKQKLKTKNIQAAPIQESQQLIVNQTNITTQVAETKTIVTPESNNLDSANNTKTGDKNMTNLNTSKEKDLTTILPDSERPEVEMVLQKFLSVEMVIQLLNENKKDVNETLTLISNNNFPGSIHLEFKDKKVKIVSSVGDPSLDKAKSFIYIAGLRISNNRAIINFFYEGSKGVMTLKKDGRDWYLEESSISEEPSRINSSRTIIQQSLDEDILKELFEKDLDGNFKPLVIVTNGKISRELQLDFAGKMIKVFRFKDDAGLNPNEPYLDITRFKLKKKKSILSFKYKGLNARIELKRENGIWVSKSSNISID